MARQKCVMSAMLDQVSPQVAVRNFEKIADASSAMISTDIPASEVDRFMALALKAKGQKISTLSLVPPMINTADPDIALIQKKVTEAIDRAEGTAPKSGKPHKRSGGGNGVVTGGSVARSATGTPRTRPRTSSRPAEPVQPRVTPCPCPRAGERRRWPRNRRVLSVVEERAPRN